MLHFSEFAMKTVKVALYSSIATKIQNSILLLTKWASGSSGNESRTYKRMCL